MSFVRLAVWAMVLAFAVNAIAASDYQAASKMITLPSKVSIDGKGKVSYEKSFWKEESQPDGTQLLTSKSKPDSRVAILRTKKGELEILSAYQMKNSKAESSVSVAFEKDHMASFTSCEEAETSNSPGRVCVTATPRLCQSLKSGSGLDETILKQMDAFEMKALATILTLRGSDHQLDNMVKSGNRLGLKSALQTTKGQLIALARQIAKESGKPDPLNEKPRDPAQEKRAQDDSKIAKEVLEEALPRLKRACVDAEFTGA